MSVSDREKDRDKMAKRAIVVSFVSRIKLFPFTRFYSGSFWFFLQMFYEFPPLTILSSNRT